MEKPRFIAPLEMTKSAIFDFLRKHLDSLYDARYGVDTCGIYELEGLTITSANKVHVFSYKPSRLLLLRRLFMLMKPLLPENPVLVDFGCGKGRVLLVASEFAFKHVRGIEFARELCRTAKRNCRVFRVKTAVPGKFQVQEADVADYGIRPHENVFFLFNPFDHTVLSTVMDNILASLRRRDRRILILYKNPEFKDVIEQRGFINIRNLHFRGNTVLVYSNR